MATVNPEEQDVALSIANHPATRLQGPSLLHHLVQHRSEPRDDDALAIDYLAPDDSRVSLSYHELHQKSDALAARISSIAGPVTDDNTQLIVPVLIPQCPELYISQLAILKAGGAFCPLNLDIPLERAKFILNEVSAALVITASELAERVPENETGKKVLILSDELFTSSTETVEHRQPTPDNIAYVMYTSGSTGTPKGVPITHDAATQSLLAHDRHIPAFSRFLQFAAPTFDVSVFETFFPLFRGKTLVSCNRSAMLNDLPGVINSLEIDACELTPSVAGSLLRKRSNAPGLKLLLTIGEMLTQPVIHEFGGSETKQSILWGMYGPTEASIHCTVQPAFSADSVPGLIGFSLDTVSCFILAIPPSSTSSSSDSEITILPIGQTGELAIGGHQLAPSYLNRPETTAEAFISHPLYGLLYRTKDKARMLPDGTMQCLGRIGDDKQVKLRGQRIELGEIEHAALRSQGCHSAVAAVVGERGVLVLFCAVDFVSDCDEEEEEEEAMAVRIEKECRDWLPGFMVPGDIVVMKEFPRLASGKVDRKGLVAGYESMMASRGQLKEEEFVDEKERQIYVAVRNVLGVVVRPTQSLMRAGMDSLSAIKLASALRKSMGVKVGANEILGARTIRALREVVREVEAEGTKIEEGQEELRTYEPAEVAANIDLLKERLGDVEAVMPCTPLQTAMLSETTANPRAYCNWLKLRFPEGCMETEIRSWFLQLAQSNEALRTGFVHHDGQFLQVIFKSLDESLISVADNITEEFSLLGDQDFLSPFRVFITPSSDSSPTTILLQIHHAIYDGWSTTLLLSDLHSLLTNTTPIPRPSFRAITSYYHSPSYRLASNAAREFWAQHLTTSFQPPSLQPSLQPSVSSTVVSVVQSHTIHLPPSLSPHHIKSVLLHSLDCTPQVLFQSALAWLWSVYVGSQDVVIGTVTSGRTIPVSGIEEIVGPCIATVPLRTDLSGVRTVRDLLGSVQAVGREVVRHGILPLKEIKKVAGVKAGKSLFEVLVVYQEVVDVLEENGGKGGGGERRVVEVEEQGRDWLETKLLVEVEPKRDTYDLVLTYHVDAFTGEQVKVLGEQLGVLVGAMLEGLDREVEELKGVFPGRLLSMYNERPKTLEGVPDLAKAVEAAVERNPEQEALCFAEKIGEDGTVDARSVSYAELNATANRIAWLLQSQGVKEGDIVAIVMEKSVLLYAGILAILKAGCAYLPLLPTLPTERVKTVFGQAGVQFCLTDTDSKTKLQDIPNVEFIDIQTTDLTSLSTANPNLPINPSRTAYIIYTSGSTGIPKGVCVTQLNIVSNLDVLSRIYPFHPGTSRLLQSCSQAFDVSVFEIFFAWTQSLTLCSGTNDVLFSDLEHSIRSLSITHLSMTPTVASLVSPENVPGVEFLVTAGEPMTPAVANKWHKQLWQGYGPSETTNICSVKRMVIPPLHRIRHLGWVFPNTSAFVVYPDSDAKDPKKLELVPIGGFGELCFGGDQVVKGYLGQDELTREKFVVHEEWGRVYRSGDLGRMLADGSLVIWGRVDEQVKVRGQRVELGEVNNAVQQAAAQTGRKVGGEGKSEENDGVECATLFFKSKEGVASTIAGQGQIVSFYVPPPQHKGHEAAGFEILDLNDGLKSEVRSIFQSVEAQVPSYMIPSFIIPISKLPVTAAGKLDRRLLETSFTSLSQEYLASVSPSLDSSNNSDDDSGEWSDTENQVAEIVCRVFAVERGSVQRWTPLTAFGLDSISAIELSKQLAMNLGGKRLAISTVLRNATVAKIAGALEQERSPGDSAAVSAGDKMGVDVVQENEPLVPENLAQGIKKQFEEKEKKVEKILPCTPLQEGMLAASVGRGRGAYVNKMLLKLSTTINVEALRTAWAKACKRQGILRTAFVSTEDPEQPMIQVVLEAGSWSVPWLEYHATSTDDLDKVIDEHVSTLSEPVDSFEPPISLQIIGAGDERYLSFICHHVLYDGVAIQRLLYEVEQLLAGNQLPPAPPYEPFLRESLALAKAPETEKFWRDQLTEFHPRLLTESFRFPPTQSTPAHAPTLLTTPVPTPLSQITSRTKSSNISLLSLVQASWATVLSVLLRSEDVCFGNVLSGRTLPIERIDELVAPCFNTVPVRMKLGELAGDRNLDLVRAFGELGAKVLEGKGFVGLRRVQGLVRGEGKVFDTLVLLQQGGEGQKDEGKKVWEVVRDEGGMVVPIVVEFVPDARRDELVVNLHLEGGHFPKEFADLILDLLFTTLDNFLQYPASHVWRFDTLPATLKEKLAKLPFDDSAASASSSARHAQGDDGNEEWSNLESRIRNVLTSLMTNKDRRIGRQTTIYQLGLDSISAVQIASMLRRDLASEGVKVNASDVIARPSCAGLAKFLEGQQDTSQAATDTESRTVTYDIVKFQQEVQSQIEQVVNHMNDVEKVLPCTPLQSGMWMQFLSSAQNGGRDYLNFLEYRINASSGVGLEDLQRAWNRLFQAQPILRTGLVAVEHDDCAFAMVQYHHGSIHEPVVVVKGQPFDVDKWRDLLARDIVDGEQPIPWGIVLVENDDELTMHVGMHHVLYDAQSLQTLMKELAKAVSGETLTPSTATETEAAVADILTQIETSRETAENFWKAQADKTVINSFPVMTPLKESSRKIQVETLHGGMSLPELEKAAAESGYSLQVLIQASWARILSAYLGESSVTFGVVLSGRNTDATKDAVFPCITTLPVIAANVAASNREVLDGMMRCNAELYKQQHQPLGKIQQWLGRQETRLFDTLVVYQKFSSSVDEEGEQKEAPWILVEDAATIDYPVSIEVEPLPTGEMKYAVTFFDDVLPCEQAQLLLRQFQAMVEYLALHPSGDEDGLLEFKPELFAILPPEQPTLPVPDEIRFLHQFVRVQARKTPEKTALFFADGFDPLGKPVGREWSYRELDANGNRVANMLSGHVKVGDIVAVYFDKCPEAFFAILGVLKAGASFVALDPGAPEARKEFIVRDSGATALLTTAGKAAAMDFAVDVPVLGVDLTKLNEVSAASPILNRELLPSDAAYCLYTSGTTGTPKGCEITHDNTVQCMLAFQHIFTGHWEPNSRWLQFASLHFDVSVLEQYWTWSVGITLVGAPKDLILEDLAGTISRLEITHIDLTPSLARLVHPDDVPSLCRGVFITGGESLKQEILDVWGDKAVIYNFYGPTEATIGVTVYPRVPRNGRASNIGRQFINVGSYVLKPGTDRPVLRGAVGELCVSGKLVGKGYLGREDLTKERFPTLSVQGKEERVYRTGDLVRVLHDDCFDFLGRADDQVKLRGQRLEIGEINHSIKTGVNEVQDVATVVIHNEKAGKDFLVAFVTTAVRTRSLVEQSKLEVIRNGNDTANLVHKVRQACRAKLPGYMVPTYVVRLPYIPLSANNKAEIKELKRLFGSLSQEELVGLSPAASSGASGSLSPTGQKVAHVLSEMLAIDVNVITPSTSIFELGLDSISALRFSRALKRSGFPQASPSLILSHPLIADLSQALDSAGKTQSNTAQVAAAKQLVQACQHRHMAHVCKELGVSSDRVEYIAPCTGLQAGMIARREKYYNTFRFKIPNDGLDLTSLKGAWDKVVEAYPILRTKFVQTTEGFVQVALKSVNAEEGEVAEGEQFRHWRNEAEMEELWGGEGDYQSQVKMEEVIAGTREDWLRDNADGVVRRTVELQLYNIPTPDSNLKERILVLHIFHGVYDANSLEIILSKVQELCRPNSGQDPNPVKEEKEPDFLEALYHGPLQNFAHSRDFWVEHLQHATPKPSFAVAEEASTKAITSHRTIPFTSQSLTKTLKVTTHSLLQAAWISALARQFNVRSPTIGVIVSGRAIELPDGGASAEQVVGPLFNTLPFHASSLAGKGYSELVRQCHDWNSKVVEWQHVPLRDIQKWCGKVGRGLFEVLFSFQQQSTSSEEGEEKGERVWEMMDEEGDTQADYPLALEATLTRDGEAKLLIVAQEAAIGKEVVDGLMEGLVGVLREMGEDVEGEVVADDDEVDEAVPKANEREDTTTKTTGGTERREFVWTAATRTVQEEIAALAEVDTETVTSTTSILELGLDSIDTIKLSARLKQLGVNIKPSELMKAQTIEGLVPYLDEQKVANGDPQVKDSSEAWKKHADKIRAELGEDIEAVLPATPLQDGMVAEMIHSNFQLYFNHDIMEVQPHVNLDKLKAAWQTVIANSPILRTSFVEVDDPSLDFAYFQIIHRQLPTTPSITSLEIKTEDDLSKITATATALAQKTNGSSNLLQLTFATLNNKKFVVLSIAHALYDGWSLSLLHRDVQAAYQGRYTTPRPFYDAYLREIIRSGDDRSSSFWSGYLAGAKPTFYPRLLSGESSGDGQVPVVYRHETISQLDFGKVRSFTKQHAITLQTLGQACHAAVLATATRNLDVMFGVVLSGRSGSEEAEQLLFPTMNTVAVRSILHGDVAGWLRYMQSVANDIGGREHFPLRKMQRLVEGGAHGGQGQLFNTLFIMQRGVPGSNSGEGGGEVLTRSVGGSSAVEYPVCVEMEVVSGPDGKDEKLVWRTACDSRFVDGQQGAEGLLEKLDMVLRFLVEGADGQKDVLEFVEGGKMRVCGLEGFTPVGGDDTVANDEQEVREAGDETAWSELEEKIRAVLAEVAGLEVPAVQKGNNIYHLGLDSISAIKVVSLVRKQGVLLPLRQLLKARNISEMAQAVVVAEEQPAPVSTESIARNDIPNGTNAIDDTSLAQQGIDAEHITTLLSQSSILSSTTEPITDKIEAILPATGMQVHMLSVWQNTLGDIFHATFTYRLTGNVSKSVLSTAWKSLVAEFPILRTIFLANDQPETPVVQVIFRHDALVDHSVEEDSYPKQWSSLSNKEARSLTQPFNFMSGHQSDNGDWILSFKIHHALYDAISFPMMVNRFAALCSGAGSTLEEDTSKSLEIWKQYSTQRTTPDAKDKAKKFWTEYLAGAQSSPITLATLHAGQADPESVKVEEEPQSQSPWLPSFLQPFIEGLSRLLSGTGIWQPQLTPSAPPPRESPRVSHVQHNAIPNISRIKKLCSAAGVSIQALFFAAYALFLSKTSASANEVVFGVYLANRSSELTDIPYPTLCLVPLRVKVKDSGSLLEMAKRIQEDLYKISAPENVGVGLWEIKQWTGVEVDGFVNFLSVPSKSDGDEVGKKGQEKVGRMELVSEEEVKVMEGEAGEAGQQRGFVVPMELEKNAVRDAYPDAIDVEVAIEGDAVTIGVFGSREKMGPNGPRYVVTKLVEALMAV
ncbi:putative non-ribosomal peptide synthase [Sordaria brevicollis]|uniref:Non-ribosomal peptide synthase n=1 Tax=Sordaria brevicollis TaxID=83679 RepID=A0AAE0PM78_SORBR|nr:putative non-ribosomal peptide synthase [Sordaria brevicollis]